VKAGTYAAIAADRNRKNVKPTTAPERYHRVMGHDAPAAGFKPQVARPRPRLRLGFVVALLLVLGVAAVVLLVRSRTQVVVADHHATNRGLDLRAHCTPLEAEQFIRTTQLDGGSRATCYAIAGKIDRARQILHELPTSDSPSRQAAVSLLFETAHPIADAGDDESAGPIMELVIEFWPENYMAMFHAGMAAYALGKDDIAKQRLDAFLVMYTTNDVWHQRAVAALAGIRHGLPLAKREAHFAE
jgi:hypothetical protein